MNSVICSTFAAVMILHVNFPVPPHAGESISGKWECIPDKNNNTMTYDFQKDNVLTMTNHDGESQIHYWKLDESVTPKRLTIYWKKEMNYPIMQYIYKIEEGALFLCCCPGRMSRRDNWPSEFETNDNQSLMKLRRPKDK